MRYLKTYQVFESKSIKFKKKPNKKGAKTETYDVIKDGETIGQIKWSSRMRGYAFLPEKEHDEEIKNFIKDLMSKRRKSKLIKEDVEMSDVEIDDHIRTLKDMALEMKDNDLTFDMRYLKSYCAQPGFWLDIKRVKEYWNNYLNDYCKSDLQKFKFNEIIESNDSLFSMIDYLESEGFELSKVEFYPANLEKYDNLSDSYQKAYIKDNKLYSLSSDMDLSDREILNLKLNFK